MGKLNIEIPDPLTPLHTAHRGFSSPLHVWFDKGRDKNITLLVFKTPLFIKKVQCFLVDIQNIIFWRNESLFDIDETKRNVNMKKWENVRFDPLIQVISTLQTSCLVYKQLNVQQGLSLNCEDNNELIYWKGSPPVPTKEQCHLFPFFRFFSGGFP